MDESIAVSIAYECSQLKKENRALKEVLESSRSPGCSTAHDLAVELLPEVTEIFSELEGLGLADEDEVGQKVNSIRHRLLLLTHSR